MHQLVNESAAVKPLFLADFEGDTEDQIRAELTGEFGYRAPKELVDRFDILIAYQSVGSWGCDSSSFFLLRDRNTGELFENHAGHCSCYGFEDQFMPEPTTLAYLRSDKFSFSCGGYDYAENANRKAVREFISRL